MSATENLSKGPPKGFGALAKREQRLAYLMLLPTFLIVLGIVLGPLLANFWISFKPVQLADLRAATTLVNEQLRRGQKLLVMKLSCVIAYGTHLKKIQLPM